MGAALGYWHQELNHKRSVNLSDSMKGSYLGPSYSNEHIERELKNLKANYKKLDDKNICKIVAEKIADNKTVGWFQGRMEFGPRALGARSILADPRSDKMQKELNMKIKFRESFRPFAPSVLNEQAGKWFEINKNSPYMLLVANVKKNLRIPMTLDQEKLFGIEKLNIKRSNIPAITHVDYSARIQTVHKETNPKYYELIENFASLTGIPVIVNTSFNIRGEPIVCKVKDAFKCFMGTNLDILVCENFILEKKEQDQSLLKNYQSDFILD